MCSCLPKVPRREFTSGQRFILFFGVSRKTVWICQQHFADNALDIAIILSSGHEASNEFFFFSGVLRFEQLQFLLLL